MAKNELGLFLQTHTVVLASIAHESFGNPNVLGITLLRKYRRQCLVGNVGSKSTGRSISRCPGQYKSFDLDGLVRRARVGRFTGAILARVGTLFGLVGK